MAEFEGDGDRDEYILPNLFTDRNLFTLSMLFDDLVLKRQREFRDARDPVFGCRTFVHDPAIEFPHVLPVVDGEVIGWSSSPSERAQAMLNAPERRKRRRIKTNRVTSEQLGYRAFLEGFVAGINDSVLPIEERPRQPLPRSDDPHYAGFDDLEYEFLLRVGSIFSGISLSQRRTPFVVLAMPEPKPRDLDRVQIPVDWFGELVMVDFARGHLHEPASLYPVTWRLRFSDITGVKLSESDRSISPGGAPVAARPAAAFPKSRDGAAAPEIHVTPATRRAGQVSLSDAIEATIAERKLSPDWFAPHGMKAAFVAELSKRPEFAQYRTSSVDRELRKVLARRWGGHFGRRRCLRPN